MSCEHRSNIKKKALTTALKRADDEITNYREILEEASTLKSSLMKEIEDDKAETAQKAAEEERKLEEKELELLLKETKSRKTSRRTCRRSEEARSYC